MHDINIEAEQSVGKEPDLQRDIRADDTWIGEICVSSSKELTTQIYSLDELLLPCAQIAERDDSPVELTHPLGSIEQIYMGCHN